MKRRKLDSADLEVAKEILQKEELEKERLKKSTVVKNSLPIPHPTNLLFNGSSGTTWLTAAEKLVLEEMRRMVETDYLKFNKVKSKKRKKELTLKLPGKNYLSEFEYEDLVQAQKLILEEMKRAEDQDTTTKAIHRAVTKGLREASERYAYFEESLVDKTKLSKAVLLKVKRAEYCVLRDHHLQLSKKADKLEKHVNILTMKLKQREDEVEEEFNEAVGVKSDIEERLIQNELYQKLYDFEEQKIQQRVKHWKARCEEARKEEDRLQKAYAEATGVSS